MSDYELERMDPAAYANAVEREQQDPLRPYRLEVERLQSRLSAAEEDLEQLQYLRNRLERAEAVVEAAKWHQNELGHSRLRDAIRRYEEGK